jgi:hypothetical protein
MVRERAACAPPPPGLPFPILTLTPTTPTTTNPRTRTLPSKHQHQGLAERRVRDALQRGRIQVESRFLGRHLRVGEERDEEIGVCCVLLMVVVHLLVWSLVVESGEVSK